MRPDDSWSYAILDGSMRAVEVTDDLDAAVEEARRLAGPGVVLTDSALGLQPVEGAPRAGYRQLAANPYYAVPESFYELEELQPEARGAGMGVLVAAHQAGLGVVSADEVMELTDGLRDVKAVHARLRPYFEHMGTVRVDQPIVLIKSLLGTNEKTSKPLPGLDGEIKGLTLVPYWRNTQADLVRALPQEKSLLRAVEQDFDLENVQKRHNWCAGASLACRRSCLLWTGQNPTAQSFKAKYARADALRSDPVAFLSAVWIALDRFQQAMRKQGRLPFVRLNMLSDIPWELVCPDLFVQFRDVQFYDYTKLNVAQRRLPENYDMTFSYSGTNAAACAAALDAGHRVAAVFVPHADSERSTSFPYMSKSLRGVPEKVQLRLYKGQERLSPAQERRYPGAVGKPLKGRLSFGEVREYFGGEVPHPFGARASSVQLLNGDLSDFRPADPPVSRIVLEHASAIPERHEEPCIVALNYKRPQGIDPEVERWIREESGFALVVPVRRWGEELVTAQVPRHTPLVLMRGAEPVKEVG